MYESEISGIKTRSREKATVEISEISRLNLLEPEQRPGE
jgi:hypothetical protein